MFRFKSDEKKKKLRHKNSETSSQIGISKKLTFSTLDKATIFYILQYCTHMDLLVIGSLNNYWNEIVNTPRLWLNVFDKSRDNFIPALPQKLFSSPGTEKYIEGEMVKVVSKIKHQKNKDLFDPEIIQGNMWACSQCTLHNALSSTKCEVCNANRLPSVDSPRILEVPGTGREMYVNIMGELLKMTKKDQINRKERENKQNALNQQTELKNNWFPWTLITMMICTPPLVILGYIFVTLVADNIVSWSWAWPVALTLILVTIPCLACWIGIFLYAPKTPLKYWKKEMVSLCGSTVVGTICFLTVLSWMLKAGNIVTMNHYLVFIPLWIFIICVCCLPIAAKKSYLEEYTGPLSKANLSSIRTFLASISLISLVFSVLISCKLETVSIMWAIVFNPVWFVLGVLCCFGICAAVGIYSSDGLNEDCLILFFVFLTFGLIVAQLILIVLKLDKILQQTWLIVFMPSWIALGCFVYVLCMLCTYCFGIRIVTGAWPD